MALFTVDVEDWNHALHIHRGDHTSSNIITDYLLPTLDKYSVKGLFYVLGRFKTENPFVVQMIGEHGHIIGNHGEYHDHNEDPEDFWKPYRSPYWDTTPMPYPPSGGFFFRAMPYSYVKWAVNKSGVFWLHPHDLDEQHPKIKNQLLNWKRHVGLKGARKKLERLLKEVKFDEPR